MLSHGDAVVMTTPVAGLMVYPVALPVASILVRYRHTRAKTDFPGSRSSSQGKQRGDMRMIRKTRAFKTSVR